jgi:hypothetical protein
MGILQFLFGHGWWIVWYLAFWFVILFGVVMFHAMFWMELKPAHEKPATASLGSVMGVMISFGLAFVSFFDVLAFAPLLGMVWWMKLLLALDVAILIVVLGVPLNLWMAEDQHYPSFFINAGLSAALIVGNLVLLHYARTGEAGQIEIGDGVRTALKWVLIAIPPIAIIAVSRAMSRR